jgi:hypothetical protein
VQAVLRELLLLVVLVPEVQLEHQAHLQQEVQRTRVDL